LAQELLFSSQICTKSFIGWRFAPDVTEELTRSPNSLAGSRVGPPGRGGKERRERSGKGDGEGKGRGCLQSQNRADAFAYNTTSVSLRLSPVSVLRMRPKIKRGRRTSSLGIQWLTLGASINFTYLLTILRVVWPHYLPVG